MKFIVDTDKLAPNILILGGIGLLIGLFTFPLTYFFFGSIMPLWSSPLVGAGIGIVLWALGGVKVLKNGAR